jgi:methionyl-tRNA formyltransferase
VRTVFLGTSGFAATVLRRLAESPHRPALVITRPDRPRGRGRRMASPAVAELARELELPVAQPQSVNADQARQEIAAQAPEAICVCAFGGLIKEPLLSDYTMLIVHPSLLPRWRGAAPVERAIMAGDQQTGVSIMRVSAGLDSGPVCAQEAEQVASDDTYGSLSARLAVLGGDLLVRTLDEQPACSQQDEARATYAQKISPQDRELDPARSAMELERVVRALTPHIGAHVELEDGSWLGVHAARAVDDGSTHGVLSLDGPRPRLGCSVGALELLIVQPPGRRPMSGEDFLRGYRR